MICGLRCYYTAAGASESERISCCLLGLIERTYPSARHRIEFLENPNSRKPRALGLFGSFDLIHSFQQSRRVQSDHFLVDYAFDRWEIFW